MAFKNLDAIICDLYCFTNTDIDMSVKYESVLWNGQKKRYDKYLWIGISLFILTYVVSQLIFRSEITIETLIIRATALSALVLLHCILAIGPLARIDSRYLPLLYNRRHAGVSMFILAFVHGVFSIIQFHSLGDTNVLISLFTSNQKYLELSQYPFQSLGFGALIIFFLMAITSHDFWLKNIGPRIWKALHMGVYIAYVLILFHVALGAFQYESHPLNWVLIISAFLAIAGLHLYSGYLSVRSLRQNKSDQSNDGYHRVCHIDEIADDCAKTIYIEEENIAIFKYNGKVSAIHNVCKHQQGPLGEGKIIDGCITCPWHAYQYLPHNGQSPPPFSEKVKTYRTKLIDHEVWVNPDALPEGTEVEPAVTEISNNKNV